MMPSKSSFFNIDLVIKNSKSIRFNSWIFLKWNRNNSDQTQLSTFAIGAFHLATMAIQGGLVKTSLGYPIVHFFLELH